VRGWDVSAGDSAAVSGAFGSSNGGKRDDAAVFLVEQTFRILVFAGMCYGAGVAPIPAGSSAHGKAHVQATTQS
jgi:hypothetical protein